MENVPYTLYEASQARFDRRFRQMWVLVIILVVMLVGTNAGWIIYESQYESIETTVTQDAETGTGNAIIYGNEVHYGEGTADGNN